jgi:hypothetical protein
MPMFMPWCPSIFFRFPATFSTEAKRVAASFYSMPVNLPKCSFGREMVCPCEHGYMSRKA